MGVGAVLDYVRHDFPGIRSTLRNDETDSIVLAARELDTVELAAEFAAILEPGFGFGG